MQRKIQQGFTLIEILIVVAIIAILASVVLIGLGPSQQAGRDARRISDLHEVQTALQLYYNEHGSFPADTTWATLTATLEADTQIDITQVPNDPTPKATYYYAPDDASGQDYVLGAQLETGSQVFNGYNPPTVIPTGFTLDCKGASDKEYCLSL